MSGGGDDRAEDSKQSRQLASIAAEKWNLAQTKLRPLQEEYLEDVRDIDSDENRSFVQGRVNAGMQLGLSDNIDAVNTGGAGAGLDVGSGKSTTAMTDAVIAAATGGADTAARADFELGAQEEIGLSNYLAMGTGQEASALSGMSDVSRLAGQKSRSDAVTAFNRRSANLQTLGATAGAMTSHVMNNPPEKLTRDYSFISEGAGSKSYDPNVDFGSGLDLTQYSNYS